MMCVSCNKSAWRNAVLSIKPMGKVCSHCIKRITEIYLNQAPLQRSESSGKPSAWVWLTIEQVHECWEKLPPYFNEKDFAKIVEAKCKELNTCPSDNSDADTTNIFYTEKGVLDDI